jgi:hypothetical protein
MEMENSRDSVGGSGVASSDNVGPEIRAWLNMRVCQRRLTNPNPVHIVGIFGINILGQDIGHLGLP